MAPPISPLRAQYGFAVALLPMAIRAPLCSAYFAPLGSIRLRSRAMCSFHCAHTHGFLGGAHSRAPRALCYLPTPYGRGNKTGWARSPRGCAPLTPGCVLAPFQGASFPRQICHICLRQMFISPRHLWRGWPTGRGRGHELHFLPFSWMISRTISGASPEYRTISRSFIPCESIFATIVCCIMAIPSSIPSLCPCLRPFFKPI